MSVASDDPLVSKYWSHDYLLALGRVIELTALNESIARNLLSHALGLPYSGLSRQMYGEAMFLGVRIGEMTRRLSTLAEMDAVLPWVAEAASWTREAKTLNERRDALVHRSPTLVSTDTAVGPGIAPSRRTQAPEIIDQQAVSLVRALAACSEAGLELASRVYRLPSGVPTTLPSVEV